MNVNNNTPDKADLSNSNKVRNFLIIIVAIALSMAIYLGLKTQTPVATLDNLAQQSTPIEIATSNGQPTLIEFYADWCNSCQAMAKDMSELKQEFNPNVNFVMLNVDNNKWLPEILRYKVDGIPHFVFLNQKGENIGENIGEVPKNIMKENLIALINTKTLPYNQNIGQVSQFNPPISSNKNSSDDPRNHGN